MKAWRLRPGAWGRLLDPPGGPEEPGRFRNAEMRRPAGVVAQNMKRSSAIGDGSAVPIALMLQAGKPRRRALKRRIMGPRGPALALIRGGGAQRGEWLSERGAARSMNRHSRVFRVGISGSYGGLNLGDEAILEVIITELRRSLPVEITVFSRDPADTLARHRVERAVPVRELSRDEVLPEIEGLDLLILGGGGILYDGEAHLYVREALLAQERKIPVLVYAVSAGPLREPTAQRLTRTCLQRAAAVTVRERRARQVLEEIGVQRDIDITADPALLLEPQPLPLEALKREGLDTQHRLVGVSVREPGAAAPDIDERHYHALLANAADYMVDRLDADLVFVPMERRVSDPQHCHAVVSQMAYAQRATVLKGEYTAGQMLTMIRHFAFVVGCACIS